MTLNCPHTFLYQILLEQITLIQIICSRRWTVIHDKFITIFPQLHDLNLKLYSVCGINADDLVVGVNAGVYLWLQVWHQPREYHPVRTEHRDRSHCRPGVTLRVCRRGSALSADFRHESGLPRHKENLLLRCFPQVSPSQRTFDETLDE